MWGAEGFYCILFLMYFSGVGVSRVLLYFISHVFGRCGVQKGFTVFYLSCIWQVWGAGRFYCILSLMYLVGVGCRRVLLYFISHVFGRCGVQEGFTVFCLSCIW